MIKRLSIFIFLISFISGSVQAQNVQQGKAILSKVSKKYRGFKSMKADFKYTIEVPKEKFKEDQKGTLYVKGGKFKLDLGQQVVICDGQTLWTYLKDDNSVTVSKYEPKSMGVNPTEIFTMYDKGYNSAYMGDEGSQELVELTPTNKNQEIFKVKLYIDKAKGTISKSRVFQKNGNILTYDITSFTPNDKLADNFFTFDKSKYPKVMVTDLRN